MKRKPKMSLANIQGRLNFADNYIHWTKEWQKIFFSYEKQFNLNGPDGLARFAHQKRIFSKRQSGGSSVMVWVAIGYLKKFHFLLFRSE